VSVKIFTKLYQFESLEEDHDINDQNEAIFLHVNKILINVYNSLEEETDEINKVFKLMYFMLMSFIFDLLIKE
jgi:hypothetical protein